MNFEYVASGLGHTRILQKSVVEGGGAAKINDMISLMQGKHGHGYSCLFNAHTEKGFGAVIERSYPGWCSVHSDSGGLQIITQGLTIDDAMKESVYEYQSKWSDVGMSFDEIPIQLTGETSSRNDVDNRFFDDSNYLEYARLTGVNITKQIEYFLNNPTNRCKPLLIIQGNCVDTYRRWNDMLLKTIPSDLHQYIGGISLGAAGLGTGPLEDIERMFAFTQLEAPDHVKSKLHILGVGSSVRLLPAIMLKRNGLIADVHTSYDSTTHTSGVNMGNFYSYAEKRLTSFPINYSNQTRYVLDNIKEYFGLDFDPQFYIDSLKSNNAKFSAKYGDCNELADKRAQAIFGFVGASILNFTRYIDELVKDEYTLTELIQRKRLLPMLHLQDVVDMASWKKWESNFGKRVPSKRVKKVSDKQGSNSLFDFL